MVSKKLQDKFYAALESLKDGKNDYILEALAAGAKATFEGLLTGKKSEDRTYIPSKDEVSPSASIGPGQFSEEEYPMVAEAVAKLGNAIGEMKTADNAPLVESIMEGFNACFPVEK